MEIKLLSKKLISGFIMNTKISMTIAIIKAIDERTIPTFAMLYNTLLL